MNRSLILIFLMGCLSCSRQNEITDTRSFANEKFRPKFHFTPQANWMNDPNGLVFYEGEYHLFYQYYPDSTITGPRHWGHAVSRDLIHWEHLPIGLSPDELGEIYSGSAVVDWNNSSGLGSIENPPIVAIYTNNDSESDRAGNIDYETQSIAYSTDKGRSWTKYEENPVIPNPGIRDFRDPKVFWSEDFQKWIMVLAVTDHIAFYSSSNLINWRHESDFGKGTGAHGGVWECPDLFKLPVRETKKAKWVLLVSINPGGPNGGSATQYFAGDFNGKYFIPDDSFTGGENKSIWIDYGADNYAGVTWSDIPESDGRRIFIGWMSNWKYATVLPTISWRSAMTVPRTLELRKKNDDYILASTPVSELQLIKGGSKVIDPQNVDGSSTIKSDYNTYELLLNLKFDQSEGFDLAFSNVKDQKTVFGINKADKQIFLDRSKSGATDFEKGFANIHYAPYNPGDSISLQILVDVASIEIFVDQGSLVMTEIFFPDTGFNNIEISSKEGTLDIRSGRITELTSIW